MHEEEGVECLLIALSEVSRERTSFSSVTLREEAIQYMFVE
jgi:hypothetical protein